MPFHSSNSKPASAEVIPSSKVKLTLGVVGVFVIFFDGTVVAFLHPNSNIEIKRMIKPFFFMSSKIQIGCPICPRRFGMRPFLVHPTHKNYFLAFFNRFSSFFSLALFAGSFFIFFFESLPFAIIHVFKCLFSDSYF